MRRRVGGGAALGDLRAGRLRAAAYSDLAVRGELSATEAESGAPTCHAILDQELPLGGMRAGGAIHLSIGGSASSSGVETISGSLTVSSSRLKAARGSASIAGAASSGGAPSPPAIGDPLRTRCPGPSSAEVLGRARPARRWRASAARPGRPRASAGDALAHGRLLLRELPRRARRGGDNRAVAGARASWNHARREPLRGWAMRRAVAITVAWLLRRAVAVAIAVAWPLAGPAAGLAAGPSGVGLAPAALRAAAGAPAAQLPVGIGGPHVVSLTDVPVRFAGELSVGFHGEEATGCAAHGLCGYSGTVAWQPPPAGTLSIAGLREHGQIAYRVSLGLSGSGDAGPGAPAGGVATADVRGPSAPCTDAAPSTGGLELRVRRHAVVFAVARSGGELTATRCAGPLDGDYGSALPSPTLSLARLRRGRTTIGLQASAVVAAACVLRRDRFDRAAATARARRRLHHCARAGTTAGSRPARRDRDQSHRPPSRSPGARLRRR